jgi:hypothetical protein
VDTQYDVQLPEEGKEPNGREIEVDEIWREMERRKRRKRRERSERWREK